MKDRPAIGARVRVLANTRIPSVDGREGRVTAHHEDGIAFKVELIPIVETITCDPMNVELVSDG